ncbi:hypothetical protein [Paraburkholderia youngii]|uniref:hypothetical protein n=1 Tax=Paraburkholderia youngii TaxID=2782701 RepID=UPI003D2334E0
MIATVAELESNLSSELAAVRGATAFGREGYAEYGIFAKTDKRLHPHGIKEVKLGAWGSESFAEQLAELKQRREKARGFFDLAEGVVADEELAGRGGMSFMLMPDAHHDAEAIERAASYLRSQRDAVEITFVRLEPYCVAEPV